MDIFIIAALSADGFIARGVSEVSTAWTSAEDKKRFVNLTKEAGVLVMGRRTFETFGSRPLKNRLLFVYTRDIGQRAVVPGVEWTNLPPARLVAELENRGFQSLAICGGAEIYSQFMAANLVSRLFLTIEPVLFGRGVSLFSSPLEQALVLDQHLTVGQGTQFLDYSLKKPEPTL